MTAATAARAAVPRQRPARPRDVEAAVAPDSSFAAIGRRQRRARRLRQPRPRGRRNRLIERLMPENRLVQLQRPARRRPSTIVSSSAMSSTVTRRGPRSLLDVQLRRGRGLTGLLPRARSRRSATRRCAEWRRRRRLQPDFNRNGRAVPVLRSTADRRAYAAGGHKSGSRIRRRARSTSPAGSSICRPVSTPNRGGRTIRRAIRGEDFSGAANDQHRVRRIVCGRNGRLPWRSVVRNASGPEKRRAEVDSSSGAVPVRSNMVSSPLVSRRVAGVWRRATCRKAPRRRPADSSPQSVPTRRTRTSPPRV